MFKSLFLVTFLLTVSLLVNAKKNKVLIIGIDGVRSDALVAAQTPNIDKLIQDATYSLDAINEGTTSSGPSWSAMLTGVWENKHGVVNNNFTGDHYAQYPHFFKHVEDYNSNLHTASICQWHPINTYIADAYADSVINVNGGTSVVETETVKYLTNENPDALFVHFDDVDGAGHKYGYSPNIPGYLQAIEKVDYSIGKIVDAIKKRTNYADENWLIIVSTDHGGLGTSHGGNSIEERNIFIICSGDEIEKKEIQKDSLLTTITPPENCLNDSVELYFNRIAKVNTALNPNFNFGSDKDFSIECRIRTKTSGDVAIVTDKDWYTGLNKGFVFSFGGGTGPWKVNIGDGAHRKDINGGMVNDGKWHTLSATFDRDGLLRIYQDGEPAGTISMSGIGDIHTGYPISFGADAKDAFGYEGSIAEVRVFKGIVSAETIKAWSCRKIDGSHPDYTNLTGYWRLTEGANSVTVKDLGTSGANGTIKGAKWQNAKDPIQRWEYDYSNTPREVDVAVCAMEHLCVPVQKDWNLDGKSLGIKCSSSTTLIREIPLSPKLRIYPNPGSDKIVFEIDGVSSQKMTLLIYNNTGILVQKVSVSDSDTITFQRRELANGIYFCQIRTSADLILGGKLFLNKL